MVGEGDEGFNNLRGEGIGFGWMEGGEWMVGGRIDGIKFKGSIGCIGELVGCWGREEDRGVMI